MSYASLSIPPAPAFSPEITDRARRIGRETVQTAAFAGQAVLAASLVWLMLAGPGLLADYPSTTTPRSSTSR